MAASSSSTEAVPPWVELPPEITAEIFHKLGAVETLMTAQEVCTTWRRVCQDPSTWRRIHIPKSSDLEMSLNDMDIICRRAVDLSQGHLTDINIQCDVSNNSLLYISQRSSQLSRLQLRKLGGITGFGLQLAVKSLPLLEELHLYITDDWIDETDIKSVGLSCPLLKSFTLNGNLIHHNYMPNGDYDYNAEAFAIARSMPQLRQLQLLANVIKDEGLKAILDCCPHLESLDLRKSTNVLFAGDLERLCSERIKDLRLPNDPMDDYPFPEDLSSWDKYDNDYGIISSQANVIVLFPRFVNTATMASSSSSSTEDVPPWVELPPEITAAILHKLGTVEILMTAQKVCTTWRRVCQDPSTWRNIHIPKRAHFEMSLDLDGICRSAVDRSQGHLTDINIQCYVSDDLLLYISQRSSQLSRLQLRLSGGITGGGLRLAVKSLPLLEELHLYITNDWIDETDIESVGLSCPLLKSFKLNGNLIEHNYDHDAEAFAIARSMPQLRQLQLVANIISDEGVKAILDCCPHLESLDLRKCRYVQIAGNLEKLCSERIKDLRLPNDPMDDYPFPADFKVNHGIFFYTDEDGW